jgi:uncharacterized protein YutE (UPF0331/DUF86 family)
MNNKDIYEANEIYKLMIEYIDLVQMYNRIFGKQNHNRIAIERNIQICMGRLLDLNAHAYIRTLSSVCYNIY